MGRVGYGGKSPRHLAGHEPTLPSKGRGRSKVPAAKKKQVAKQRNKVVNNLVSPDKAHQRFHGGKRTVSTGLAGGLKRQGGFAVKWEQEVRLLEEMIADLPAVEEGQDISPNPLFGKLRHAKAEAVKWLAKVRKSEQDFRIGAWRKFDLDEAIITSERRKFGRASVAVPLDMD